MSKTRLTKGIYYNSNGLTLFEIAPCSFLVGIINSYKSCENKSQIFI